VRLCPTGCGKNVKPGHNMCGSCWRLVPKPLQAEVWRTWDAFQQAKARRVPIAVIKPLLADYRKANDAAIKAAR
jgi:hypothetical protein